MEKYDPEKYYQIAFTIAPTYCNSRIKYDNQVCQPITTDAIGKCQAKVQGEPSDKQWNMTDFTCAPPDPSDTFSSLCN
nr:uncharacterized protein LOC129385784 isoform X2 [Dermacentor andersoni]